MFTSEDREEIGRAAAQEGIDERAMLALGLTESSGRVHWLVNGEKVPAIRPEVHVFYRKLKDQPQLQRKAVELGLAHPKPNGVRIPRSYAARYEFFHRMKQLHGAMAIESTSFGWGQVMGFNYKMLGLGTPFQVEEMASTLEGQTKLVALYLKATGLTPFLNNLPNRSSAEKVAHGYNGPAWRKNDYANKLITNWKYATTTNIASGRSMADVQTALTKLGYDPGAIDGIDGAATRAAVRAFQSDNGLAADGDAGPMTWEALDYELSKISSKKKQSTKDTVGAVGVGVGATAVVVEQLENFSALKDTILGFFSGMTIDPAYVQIALALAVAYIVYNQYFKKS